MATRRPDGVTESLRIRAHPGLCEGWAECHRWAPDVYVLDGEGYLDVHVLEVPPELAVAAWQGAGACPIGVISIVGLVGPDGVLRSGADESAVESAVDLAEPDSTRNLA